MVPAYLYAARLRIAAHWRAPRCFKRGQRLKAKETFTADCHVDHGMTSALVQVTVPKATEVIFEGPSFYGDFAISFSEQTLSALGESAFGKDAWVLKMPRAAYTFSVASRAPQTILGPA